MTPVWLLWIVLASGEFAVVPQQNALQCDTARAAIVREAIAAEHAGACPMAVDAQCVEALATPEFSEGE